MPERVPASERLARIEMLQKATESDLARIETALEKLVTRIEFRPVQILVYGLVGIILSTVIGAMMTLLVSSQ